MGARVFSLEREKMDEKVLYCLPLIGILLLTAIVAGCSNVSENVSEVKTFPTYFDYTPEEIGSLRALDSNKEMTTAEIYKWETVLYDLNTRKKIGETYQILPYLVVAQRDAAFLSFNAHGKFKGSLDPISKEVFCLFYPNVCPEITVDRGEYSELLAKIILKKVQAALAEEKEMRTIIEPRTGDQYWHSESNLYIDHKTWLIDSVAQFNVAEPLEYGSNEEKNQLEMVKAISKNITDEQRKLVFKWSGGPGVKSSREHWLVELASPYMRKNNIGLDKTLMIRSVLELTLIDAYNADTYWKFNFSVKRPFMRDPTLLTVMPTPDSPSYPSVSTATAAAGKEVMNYYFPENKQEWDDYSQQMASSRVWSGVHFPKDINEAVILGEKIGRWVISNKVVNAN